MNDWYGNLTDGQSVKMTFNTYLFATGASATITDLIASDVLVSKDGVSQTTQGAGVTVEIDKNATGAHFITIDTSNTTDAGFYDTGADYQVEFIGATIDTATVNSVVGSFSIKNRSDEVDLTKILGTALTETPGQLAAAFKKLFNVAVPVLVASDVMRGTDGVDTATMRGTDGVDTATMRGTDGVDTTTMRGTDDAATETKQDAGDVVTSRISAIQEADKQLDDSTTPWTLKYKTKGTSTVLLKKDLTDIDDVNVTTTEQIIATETDVTP